MVGVVSPYIETVGVGVVMVCADPPIDMVVRVRRDGRGEPKRLMGTVVGVRVVVVVVRVG